MEKYILRFIAVIILPMLITGCWDKAEMNELGIALALGIDMDGDLYKVSAQVVLPTEVASKSGSTHSGSAVTLYQASGPTLYEAIGKLIETCPRKLYISQLRVVVLGEEFARNGISNLVESLMRDVVARTDYFVVVAKGQLASEALQVSTPLEKIPSNQLFSSLLASSKTWAPTTRVTIDELMKTLVSNGVHPVLTGIEIEGNEERNNLETIKPKTEVRVSSLAVFKKDHLIGWLNEKESKGYNYIQDKVNQSFGHVPVGKGLVGVRVLRSSTEKKAEIIRGEPHIKVKVTNLVTIVEIGTTGLSLKKQEDIHKVERACEDAVVQIMHNTCDVLQHKFRIDNLGIGNLIQQTYPTAWKALQSNWDKHFSELQIDLSAEVQVRRVGQLGDTYINKMRENTK